MIYRVRKVVGTMHFSMAIWRRLGGAGPNTPSCSSQVTLSVPTASHLHVTGALLEKRDRRLSQSLMLALRQTNLDVSRLSNPIGRRGSRLLGCSSQFCIRLWSL